MKVVLAAYGSRGDVEPCAVVGRELQRRAHQVRIAVPPNLLAFVESEGLAAVPYGGGSSVVGGIECDPGDTFSGVVSIDLGRLDKVVADGYLDANLYLDDPDDGVGGGGAFFLLLDRPEVYGLPPDPVVTTRDLSRMWLAAGAAGLAMVASAVAAVLGGGK